MRTVRLASGSLDELTDRERRARMVLLDEVAWSHGGAIRREGCLLPGGDADWLFVDDRRLDEFVRYLFMEFPDVRLEISGPKK
jgi:hypothetical protein